MRLLEWIALGPVLVVAWALIAAVVVSFAWGFVSALWAGQWAEALGGAAVVVWGVAVLITFVNRGRA